MALVKEHKQQTKLKHQTLTLKPFKKICSDK